MTLFNHFVQPPIITFFWGQCRFSLERRESQIVLHFRDFVCRIGLSARSLSMRTFICVSPVLRIFHHFHSTNILHVFQFWNFCFFNCLNFPPKYLQRCTSIPRGTRASELVPGSVLQVSPDLQCWTGRVCLIEGFHLVSGRIWTGFGV